MRAARLHAYGPPEVMTVDEVPEPVPGPRDVLVRVAASSINPVDAKIRAGSQRAVVRLSLPWITGMDVAGVVEAVGAKVTRFKVGDAVVSSPTHRRPGTFAERVAIDERAVALKPRAWTFAEAATLPLVGLTAWGCLVDAARLRAGQRVLIHAGAGGVGCVAIQLAKHLGAEVSTTASARNADFVRGLGADHVVDYTKDDFVAALAPHDVVLDALGGEVFERSLRAVKRGGVLVSINTGLPDAVERWGPNLGVLAVGLGLARRAWVTRVGHGARYATVVRAPDGERLASLVKLCDEGAIKPTVSEVIPLERIVDAHRAIETGRTRGKIAIAVSEMSEAR
ncbi:MAG: NADP-dependent oxidoreductase [Polyangiales bacterium]